MELEKASTIQHQAGGGLYCIACNVQFKFTTDSKIQRHIDSNAHRKKIQNISQVAADRFSQPATESPNIQEQVSQTNTQASSNLKASHGRSRSEYKSPYRMMPNSDLANSQNSAQPTGNDGLFQIPRKTEQQELEENTLFLKGKVDKHFLDGAKEYLSQTPSFASNILTNWESLSRMSQESLLSEATKLLLEEKDKRIKQLEEQALVQNVKLELKDGELVKLRGLVGGLEIQEMKVELAQTKVRLEERDKEVDQVKTTAEKQLAELKELLKQKDTQICGLQQQIQSVNATTELNTTLQHKNEMLLSEKQKLEALRLSCKLCCKVRQFNTPNRYQKTMGTQVTDHDFWVQSGFDNQSGTTEYKSSGGQSHEQCNKLIEELKSDKSKLEKMVEVKDQQLTDARAELKQRETEWLEQYKQVYNLSKQPNFHEELKRRLQSMTVSHNSKQVSPHESPIYSQNEQSQDEIMEEVVQIFGFQNIGFTCYAGAALQCVQAIWLQLTGSLLIDDQINRKQLKDYYINNLTFEHIFAQNDSSEALLQLLEKCLSGQFIQIQVKQERRTQCRKCKAITGTSEKQLLLSLPCSHSDFQNCLKNYLMKESMVGGNQFECTKCKNKVDADTWLELQQTNEILLIQLNRFASDGITTKKRNDLIEMPLKFVLNNQQYELFVFVVHLSQSANEGHYIAYSNCNGIWSEYNDDQVTASVDIDRTKDKAYYYCYRRVIEDYAAHVEQMAQSNVVEKECVYCHDIIVGPATHYVPGTGEISIAGAMVDHLKHCNIIASYSEKIRIALQNHTKENLLFNLPSWDIRAFFSQASRTLTWSQKQVCIDIKLVKNATKKSGTKILRAKAKNLPTQQQLEEEKLELVKLKAELAALACTWTYKWDPVFVKMTPHIIIDGEVAWAGYVPPVIQYITNAVCDEDGNAVYGTNTTQSNVRDSIYGKRRSAADIKLERQAKIVAEIPLNLKELKAEEIDHICDLVTKNNDLFQQFQEWMLKYKVERDLSAHGLKKFEWVGPAFCDGFIVPKLPIFQSNDQYQAFLQKHGKLQIQKICDAANPDCLYVRLLDSANQFTEELIEGLNTINTELLIVMDKHLSAQHFSLTVIVEAMKNCNIRQVDYTRDIKGAFYSFDMKTDLDALANLLGMRKATHDEYTSIDSCFQFLKHCKGETKELRMKFYNKIFHLIQSEQGKKKVSMNLKALFGCSAAFFEKIDQCLQEGLSRCEFSQYFNSADDLSEKLKFDGCILNLENALNALNQVPSVYNTIPIISFLDDYFDTFASNLFIFEQRQWAVVYGKNRSSSYTGIIGNPCKMGKEEFVARYTHNNIINIIDNTDESDLPKNTLAVATRVGPKIMQIPMQSLGVAHKIKNIFQLDQTELRLALSQEEVSQVKILDKEGNHFFKVVGKKQKTLKRNALPCLQAKPRKRQCATTFNVQQSLLEEVGQHIDCGLYEIQQNVAAEAQSQRKRESKRVNKVQVNQPYVIKVDKFVDLYTNNAYLSDINYGADSLLLQESTSKQRETATEEVTGLMIEKRVIIDGKKVRRLFMDGYPNCIYSSKDIGVTYVCAHCGCKLKREQKTRLFKI